MTRLPEPIEVLCHRPPMILIDRILDFGDDYLRAEVRIRDGIPFFEPSRGVPAWVGLEYMAQSIAALAGIRERRANRPVALGLLIGCRRYDCSTDRFAPGTVIESHVQELATDVDGFGSFDCTLSTPDMLATARISAFQGDRDAAT